MVQNLYKYKRCFYLFCNFNLNFMNPKQIFCKCSKSDHLIVLESSLVSFHISSYNFYFLSQNSFISPFVIQHFLFAKIQFISNKFEPVYSYELTPKLLLDHRQIFDITLNQDN